MAFDFNPNDIISPKGRQQGGPEDLRKYLSQGVFVGAIVLTVVLIAGAFYTVEPEEVAMVLRFGKFVRQAESGLHMKLPLGIESVIPVKTKRIYQEEFGFRTVTAGRRTTYSQREYGDESLMLTGDLNVMDVEWIVQFKIKDPYKALFGIRDVQGTLRNLAEAVMRKVIGDNTFNAILTEKRLEINDYVHQELQEILDVYDVGLDIVTVKLQDVNPPDQVKPAFNEVNQAKQEREKLINQAWEVYNRKIPEARGRSLKVVNEAEGYATEKVNNALGEAKRYALLQEAYAKNRKITHARLYLEGMSDILSKAGKKYIIDAEQKSILPFLQVGDGPALRVDTHESR